jgi:hypothetical protein
MASSSTAPIVGRYSTAAELHTAYSLPLTIADQIIAKTVAVADHGKTEPEGVADREDKLIWVDQGYDKLVRVVIWYLGHVANRW